MIDDAFPALLRIRAVAALVLHHAGYLPEQITAHLGETTTVADTTGLTPQLLTAAAQYLADAGFTYYGIAEAITKLRHQFAPDAQDRGLLFELEAS